jgi:hypothetical protein
MAAVDPAEEAELTADGEDTGSVPPPVDACWQPYEKTKQVSRRKIHILFIKYNPRWDILCRFLRLSRCFR